MRKTYKVNNSLLFVENNVVVGIQERSNNDLTQRWAADNWGVFDETEEEWVMKCEGRGTDWLVWDPEND